MIDDLGMLMTGSMINVSILLAFLYMIQRNTSIKREKARAYTVVVAFAIIVILSELCTTVFEMNGTMYRIPNIIANVIGFSLSAFIPYILAIIFHSNMKRYKKLIYILPAINACLCICSSWKGWIFYITSNNQYIRGPFFFAYILVYMIGLLLFMFLDIVQFRRVQNSEYNFLLTLNCAVMVISTIQIVYPSIHIVWQCVSVLLILYYLFQCEINFKYDVLTSLLNRQTFSNSLKDLKNDENVGIVLFDIDKFKYINDNYGHAKGDYCLNAVAKILKDSFSEIGDCYRIGGDEFCVLGKNMTEEDINRCTRRMIDFLRKVRMSDPVIPTLSYGYSIYKKSGDKDIMGVFQEADEKMYFWKKSRMKFAEVLE